MIGTILVSIVAFVSFCYAAIMTWAWYKFASIKPINNGHAMLIDAEIGKIMKIGIISFLVFILCILWLGI